MSDYILLKDYSKYMEIDKGEIVFITSDSKKLLWDAMCHKEKADLNAFIEGVISAVGEGGTVIFPTYNWDFCGGKAFDYNNTPCKTGTLGTLALKRTDFKRTRHPIYSFAVYGKYQDKLCAMNNTDSFSLDSPFAFFKEYNVTNYIIDVTLEHCFTFAHFAEEQSGVVKYRFVKDFTADYIDANGKKNNRTYSMFVRKLDLDVQTLIDPIENDFINEGAEQKININNSEIKKIHMGLAYDIMMRDIVENRSRKLCRYIGQED